MEREPKESGSDSDLSDGWTVLNSYPDRDLPSHDNGLIEASDEDSVESFGAEKLELPKRDEESDGISIISESDVCDHTESIPNLPQDCNDDVLRDNIEEFLRDAGLPQVHHTTLRRRHHDSLSESDSCELADSPENFSLCPRKVRRQRPNRPLSITELDTCDFVEDLPVLATGARGPSNNEACMRIYVHRPNDQINYLLTILLALAIAAVAGLGTGHFLGTKEIHPTPEEMVYELRLENEFLHNQLQELLREREVWRKISSKYLPESGDFEDIYFDCFKSTGSIYCFPDVPSGLNHSFISDQAPVYVATPSADEGYSAWKNNFQNLNNDQNREDEQTAKNVKIISKESNNILEDIDRAIISESNKNFIPLREDDPVDINEYEKGKVCFGKETSKLAEDVKLALAHGLELSDKLKEALSLLDNTFGNVKHFKTPSASSKLQDSDNFGKKALQKLKRILYGGKTKSLISKTVDRLYSMKSKLFKSYDPLNLWEGSVGEDNDKQLKFEGGVSSDVVYGPHLPSEPDESSSETHSYPVLEDDVPTSECNSPVQPDLVYGPQLPSLLQESCIDMADIPQDHPQLNEDTVSQSATQILEDDDDEVVVISMDVETLPIQGTDDSKSTIQDSFSEAQSMMLIGDSQPLVGPKEMTSEEPESEKKSIENQCDQSCQNEISKPNKMHHLKENTNKQFKKQKKAKKEQYSTKFQENNEKKLKKRKKHKAQKSSEKVSKGERTDKIPVQGPKYGKELKRKHRQKFEDGNDHKHGYKFAHNKNNYDSRKQFVIKQYDKSYKNSKNWKKNKNFGKWYKYKKSDGFRFDQGAWSMDENGYRFTNTSGEWLIKRNQARARQREDDQRSDWIFDRAVARKVKREEDRETARWYFQRARSRQICRIDPIADWCKIQDKGSHKFDKGEFWKRRRPFHRNEHDDHYHSSHNQKDWKAKSAPRHWKGTKFISQAFKAAVNLMKS